MLNSYYLLICLLGFAIIRQCNAFVNVTNVECKFTEDLCQHPICSLSSPSRSRGKISFINCGCFLVKPVTKVMARITLFRRVGKNYEPFVLDAEENICGVLNNNLKNPVLMRIFQSMSNSLSKIRCPLVGNVTVTKVPMLVNMAPGMFPDTQYMIGAHLQSLNKFVMGINVTFSMVRSSIFY